jgi:hypothetical protein
MLFCPETASEKGNAMNGFISSFSDQIGGVITGFDRLVFRGNLALNHESGMKGYLWANGIAWKDYAAHVTEVSQRVKQASLASMEACNRPARYLSSGKDSKEQIARAITREDGITSGPICALTAVEPCLTWRVAGNRETQKIHLVRSLRQCLFWLSLLDRCRVRVHERASPALVSSRLLRV